MFGYVTTSDDKDPRKGTKYHCAQCGVLIAYGDASLAMNGATRHSYVNPSGVRCNFYTFADCESVLVGKDLYEEYSWFPAYGWRFLMCASCYLHLGWKYDALSAGARPEEFFGVLIDSVESQNDAE